MMTKHSADQLELMANLADWYRNTPDVSETFIIARKPIADCYLRLQGVEARVFVKGYSKSAKALVQCGVLVDLGHCEYSITPHGTKELANLGLVDPISVDEDSK